MGNLWMAPLLRNNVSFFRDKCKMLVICQDLNCVKLSFIAQEMNRHNLTIGRKCLSRYLTFSTIARQLG